ncbi:MAG: prolyl oligopeptidase family serine peptidase [Bacteroidales bacterium]|jgi:dipeptidyl aminopeptidase/acylaminoacyl peptidase|nr:prolyl oligopeptidase family serine peptidase [Bacteroidales bacterium]
MMKRVISLVFVLVIFNQLSGQEKRPLTIDDIVLWNKITERVISDDGSLIAFKIEPSQGDPLASLYDSDGELKATFPCGTGLSISPDSHFLFFTIKPPEDTVKVLKLKKTKKDDMPMDMLAIHNVTTGITDTIRRLKSYKIPSKWSGWIAWQTEPLKEKTAVQKDTAANGRENMSEVSKEAGKELGQESGKEKGKKPKSESADNGYTLYYRELASGKTDSVRFVTEFLFAAEAEKLMYTTTGDDNGQEPGVVMVDLKKNEKSVLYTGKAKYKQLSMDKKGERAAFILSFDEKDKAGNTYSLCYWDGKGVASLAASEGTAGLPEGWIINENAPLTFGEKTRRLYFGTSPEYKLKDTTILDEDRANVDVWHWAEGTLHTAQVIRKSRDMKKYYTAVYHADLKKTVQLATKEMPDIQLPDKGDGPKAAASSSLPYDLESMWEGNAKTDVWLVDVMTGEAKKIKEQFGSRMRFSPEGKYLCWYQEADSSWYAWDMAAGRENRLTTPQTLRVWDELNDVPDLPGSYPAAGWLKDDKAFLVSDKYDIWSLDPVAGRAPVNVTVNGRTEGIKYRLLDLDTENEYVDPAEKQYLLGTDEVTRCEGFYSLDMRKKESPVKLMGGEYSLGNPLRAKKSMNLIFTKENFGLFPNYILSDISFREEKQLTNANPQQNEFLWGTAEVVRWTSLDGRQIEGLLYKPDNFDPSRKYPMIVNFYEKSSTELFRHRIPEPGRSTIDYHYYTSNGYLIFNPDVYYTDGHPGQSAYSCVMPGIMSLIEKGFVDEKHIGAQGHSWGGYQVAYLATRTTLFAAIESGAPVVNMYSAYGGIRWATGVNRSMQYEHQQSRIGATIWEAPQLYWENSPLFAVEKINTPILIMANDQDGAVPWYQGIEFFVAMRRMGKPAWLLNYNGEPHWAQKMPNRIDFQKRMSQFFNHYLKGEEMPAWMKDGIPATEKEFTLGY